ncbi:MAG: glycoside hydrolase domain-containing protein, partial [Sphingobacteriales bacterium]
MRKILLAVLLLTCNICFAQQLKYTVGYNDWDADSLGNQRVVLSIPGWNGSAVFVMARFDWRRSDQHPEKKQIILIDASTNQRILNVTASITRDSCFLMFQPTLSGRYYLYYMPYKVDRKSNYPNVKYLKPEQTASAEWLKLIPFSSTIIFAHADSIQSINAFNSPYPMEVIAKASEVKALGSKYASKKYLVFPEDRMHPVKMKYDLPQRWIISGVKNTFNGEADKGENFTYQLGVYPVKQNLDNVKIAFSDLKNADGNVISSKMMSCLNTNGVDYKGLPFTKEVNVPKGHIQAMWCLVNIPKTVVAGVFYGTATLSANGVAATEIKVTLKVVNKTSNKGGIDEPEKQTRLTWLNSTMAQHNDVIKPYTPLKVEGQTISLLGRKVILDNTGFPKNIETFFTPEMTEMTTQPKQVINQPISFMLEKSDGSKAMWKPTGVKFTEKTPGTVKWAAQNTLSSLQMDVTGSMEFDGFISYTVKVTALRDMSFNDLRLHIPFNQKSAKYMMGLNLKGEKRPATYEWKWDVANKNQDGAWIGDVNAGLQYSLRDEHYMRPLN